MATIDCVCPPRADGTPRHEHDQVRLRPKLDFRSGLAARNTVVLLKQDDPDASAAEILAALTEVYLLQGIEGWTFTDRAGKPVPVSRVAIRAFIEEHPDAAMTVGDEADQLYSEAVILPLLARAATSSPPTPIDGSTSATNGLQPEPPKRSRRSSITTTPTGSIAPISASPAGGFS